MDLGIPYRRGYLLAGPPGTGKSTLILAIASHFKLPIYCLPLRGTDLTGERISQLLWNCRKPSMVAIEDIDCLELATSRKSKTNSGLTIADLLNAIDGVGASEDRVLFMTSNHPEALDVALTRAGRVDRKFYIDYARDEELRSFHNRIAQYYSVQSWAEFRRALPERATIADAQALAFQRRTNEDEAPVTYEMKRVRLYGLERFIGYSSHPGLCPSNDGRRVSTSNKQRRSNEQSN
jgi:chaperone BCS1